MSNTNNEHLIIMGVKVMNLYPGSLTQQDVKGSEIVSKKRLRLLLDKLPKEAGRKGDDRELTNEDLCLLYQKGEEDALDLLVTKNRNLLYSRAYKCNKKFNHKLEIEDLVQWGYIGMMKAAERFDLSFGAKFSTYAVWWIDQAISRAIIDEGYTIRVPVHIFERIEKIHAVVRNNDTASGEELIDIVHKELQFPKKTVKDLLVLYSYMLNIGSLYSPVGESGDSSLVDFIRYGEEYDVKKEVEKTALKEEINNLLNTLMPREQSILEMRYGLNGYEPHTLEEIGLKYDLTRERIRQIQERALRKLRHPSKGKYLEEFLYKK